MNKLSFILSFCISSLCWAEYDALVILQGDDDRVNARILEGSDGFLYGTNVSGGDFGAGSIFKIDKAGNRYQVLHSFSTNPNDGIHPANHVIEASDDVLYGTTVGGGQSGLGTIFKINKDGSNYTILHEFTIDNIGFYPVTTLLEASDGALYGATATCHFIIQTQCSINHKVGSPSVFKINKDGTGFINLLFLNTVVDVSQHFGLTNPTSSLIEGSDGYLYGSAGSLFRVSKDGKIANLIVDSTKNGLDAQITGIDLINHNGIIYGVNGEGAANAGSVFKINENGTDYAILRSFVNTQSPHFPRSGLALDKENEILYGVANSMAYQLNTDGTNYIISNVTRYKNSYGVLSNSLTAPIFASDGALYGTLTNYAGCGTNIIPGIYSLKNVAETIFDWGETQFPQYFPSNEITQSLDPWLYRFYPLTGIYLGINNDDDGIYVLGGVFGGTPLFVDSKKSIFTQAIGVNAILCIN